MLPSSEGEESDGEIIINPVSDIDFSTSNERFVSSNDSLSLAAHRFAMIGKGHKKNRQEHLLVIPLLMHTLITR